MNHKVYWSKDYMVSALGQGTELSMQKLKDGNIGLKKEIINEDIRYTGHIDWSVIPQPKHLSRLESLFVHSISQIIEKQFITSRTALIISTTKGNIDLLENVADNTNATNLLTYESNLSLFKMAKNIASECGFVVDPIVISNACISGISAIIVASRLLRQGIYDKIVIAGGDLFSNFVYTGFNSFKSLSSEVCCSYDEKRDGLSLGEACGAILLSNDEKDSCGIEVLSGAITNDANHISGPSRTGDGLYFAIDQVLNSCNVKPEQLSFISAHGTATVFNDEMESKAVGLSNLLSMPINSTKAFTGHTLGACGVIESIFAVHQLKNNLIIGTYNFQNLGTSQQINVKSTNIESNNSCCLKMASGFGGCNAAILFAKTTFANNHPVIHNNTKNQSLKTLNIVKIEQNLNQNFDEYIRTLYKESCSTNMKFFKMDNLSKLGYVAAEKLLNNIGLPENRTKIAIILSNQSASLDTDYRHQKLINSNEEISPSVFVYTLPNIVSGEICIRHKLNGENTFFIQEPNNAFARDYATLLLQESLADIVIFGTCELLGEKYFANFELLTLN